MTRNVAVAVIVFVALVVAMGGVIYYYQHKSPEYSCVAATDEVCWTEPFYQDFKRLGALQKDILKRQTSSGARDLQDEVDLANGLRSRMISEIPQGYTVNEDRMRFIKLPAGASAAPAPVAPPAASAPPAAAKPPAKK